jgi:hypothetical protein
MSLNEKNVECMFTYEVGYHPTLANVVIPFILSVAIVSVRIGIEGGGGSG